jgi:hypothetical protein
MRVPALPVALAFSLLVTQGAMPPAQAAEPLWKDSQGAAPPADIARLNDFMHDLSERMKPPLVQVRVRRVAEQTEGQEQQPNAPTPPDERRSSGSGGASTPS